LNLTPPDEGDEAVNLTAELYCSVGVCNWFPAGQRCKVPSDIYGGKDDVAREPKPKSLHKQHHSLIDALTDPDFQSEVRSEYRIRAHDAPAFNAQHVEDPFQETSDLNQEERDLKKGLE